MSPSQSPMPTSNAPPHESSPMLAAPSTNPTPPAPNTGCCCLKTPKNSGCFCFRDPEWGYRDSTRVGHGCFFINRQTLTKPEKDRKQVYKNLIDTLNAYDDGKPRIRKRVYLEVVLVAALAALLACTRSLERLNHRRFLHLRMWHWVMMASVVLVGLSVIRFLTSLVFGAVRWLWRLHRDVSYFLTQIKTCVDVSLWLCLGLLVWYVWFRPRLRDINGKVSAVATHQVTRFLMALCLGSVLWVAKTALFLWLEADLHYRMLCDRIVHAVINLHAVQILQNFGVWQFLTHAKHKKKLQTMLLKKKAKKGGVTEESVKKFEKAIWDPEDKKQAEDKNQTEDTKPEDKKCRKKGNIWKDLIHVKSNNFPVWILKRLCDEFSDQLRIKPLRMGKELFRDEKRLMEAALKMYREIKEYKEDEPVGASDTIQPERLVNRFELSPEDAEAAFKRFRIVEGGDKKNGAKGISRDEFCSWVVRAYRSCWGLESTLRSSNHIIIKLNRLMAVFVLLLGFIIWLMLSEIVDSGQIALLFSPLLAARFMFSDSSKNMFDGLIFALAMHPFKAGDRVIIDEVELLVMGMNILTTTFYKYETGEELIYPNSELAMKHVINLEYVPDEKDRLDFSIPYTTPLEDIQELEMKIIMLLDETNEVTKTKVMKTEMTVDDIKMSAHFKYVVSNLTADCKAMHKSDMLSEIMKLLKKMKKGDDISAPLEYKPYYIDVHLKGKVTTKQITDDTIKTIIEGKLRSCYKGGKEVKAVLNYVDDTVVRMAIYIWKGKGETTGSNELHYEQEKFPDVDFKEIRRQLEEKDIDVDVVKQYIKPEVTSNPSEEGGSSTQQLAT